MSLIVETSGGNRRSDYPIVDEGAHAATLIEVRDLGIVETRFGPKHRVRFAWRIDDTQPEPSGPFAEYRVFQSFNATLSPKSELYKAVRQILGRDPGPRFDLETLIGTHATLAVAHDENGGNVYANVRAILPARIGGAE